jgi:DNA-binding MarR family transcriptional regulator
MSLDSFFPYRLAVAAESFSRQLAAVYGAGHGLSREEWRLLFLLEEAGTLDSLRLSQRTTLNKVQVSRAASRLEERGLILRTISGPDKRLRDYAITRAGRDLFRAAFAEVEHRAKDILQAMDPEDRQALERGIDALTRAVRASTEAGTNRKS